MLWGPRQTIGHLEREEYSPTLLLAFLISESGLLIRGHPQRSPHGTDVAPAPSHEH